MDEIITVSSITEYDEMVGAATLHPLVNVVDFSRLPPMRNISSRRLFGYYAIYLKGRKYSNLHYGLNTYNYEEGALVFIAPGQVAGTNDDGEKHQMTTRVLMFHPDLLKGTYLQPAMKQYTYFSYNANEALLPTEQERKIIIRCFESIENELANPSEFSMRIVIDYIKLVLDYCASFYNRQFSELQIQSNDTLAKFEKLLDECLATAARPNGNIPTVAYFASKLCLSANYFSDIVRNATGMSAQKIIHQRMLEAAKERLATPGRRINEVASEMGFQQPQNFSNWFKKMEGCTPSQYQKGITD